MSARNLFLSIPIVALIATAQIPSSFFGISALGGTYPVPTIGALAHPDFSWAELESTPGNIDFTLLDTYVTATQQHGLVDPATNTAAIAFTLSRGTPSWAVADQSNCNATSCTVPPDNMQDWKDFVTALTQHYNGIDAPQILYYELWNEANNSAYWTGTNAQMLALAKAAYPLIHKDRYSQLLTPSVVGTTQTAWMTAYLQGGGAPFSDGGAFHGYIAPSTTTPFPMPEQNACPTCYGPVHTMATQLRAVFDNFGLSGKPMVQTEGSWGSANLDPSTQSAWLARYVLLQAGLHASLNLQMAGWFAWGSPNGNLADSALQPTPAGVAYTQLYNWLVGATITKPCSGIYQRHVDLFHHPSRRLRRTGRLEHPRLLHLHARTQLHPIPRPYRPNLRHRTRRPHPDRSTTSPDRRHVSWNLRRSCNLTGGQCRR